METSEQTDKRLHADIGCSNAPLQEQRGVRARERFLNAFRQKLVAILRFLHLDASVYSLVRARAERRMWQGAWPDNGKLDDSGLCVALPIRSFCSVGQVGRDFVRRLKKTNIKFSVFDVDYGFSSAGKLSDEEVADLSVMASPKICSRNVLAFINERIRGCGRFVYANQPWWEFERGLLEFHADVFQGVRHVVAMSDFCYAYFKTLVSKSVQVHKIRYGYDESWGANEDRVTTRRRYGVPQEAFVVMFHFMFGSSAERKNPQGALRAFMTAFENEPRAHLVLKIAESNAASAAYKRLLSAVKPIKDRVTIVEGCLTRQEILNIIAASDAYLSLHRGEGLGIGLLEAMAVKTPVVCTNYGGNTEFCTPETAYLVDYKMVPNRQPDQFYAGVPEWPEPNVETAARHLRTIFESPSAAHATADRALAFMRDHFSLANFARDVRQFMEAIAATASRGGVPDVGL